MNTMNSSTIETFWKIFAPCGWMMLLTMRQNVTVGCVLLLVVTVFASSICIDQYEVLFFEMFPKQLTRDADTSVSALADRLSVAADSSCLSSDTSEIAADAADHPLGTSEIHQDTETDDTSEALRSLLTQLSVFLFK